MALTRSQQMARIRGADTKPELRLRAALWARGLRYRLRAKVPVGRPDLVFPGPKVVVFVDGCFWHGCPLHYVRPRSRCEFWADKLSGNVNRDRRHSTRLREAGFLVLRLWEHEVADSLDIACDTVERAVRVGRAPKGPAWRVYRVDPMNPPTPSNGDPAASPAGDPTAHRVTVPWERRFLVDLYDASLCWEQTGPRITRSGRPTRPRPSRS